MPKSARLIVMSPDDGMNVLPSRPHLSWDIKFVPCTADNGNELENVRAICNWCALHNNQPNSNLNKIMAENCGIVLLWNLYGRAKDLCDTIESNVLEEDDGTKMISTAIYKSDLLCIVSQVYHELQNMLFNPLHRNEPYQKFESRFAAQLAKFKWLLSTVTLLKSTAALLLLVNADVDSLQRISILAAASSNSETLLPKASLDDFVRSAKYKTIAPVIRKWDKPKSRPSSVANETFFWLEILQRLIKDQPMPQQHPRSRSYPTMK